MSTPRSLQTRPVLYISQNDNNHKLPIPHTFRKDATDFLVSTSQLLGAFKWLIVAIVDNFPGMPPAMHCELGGELSQGNMEAGCLITSEFAAAGAAAAKVSR